MPCDETKTTHFIFVLLYSSSLFTFSSCSRPSTAEKTPSITEQLQPDVDVSFSGNVVAALEPRLLKIESNWAQVFDFLKSERERREQFERQTVKKIDQC